MTRDNTRWVVRTPTRVSAECGSLFSDPAAFANSGVPTAVVAFAEDRSIRRFAEYANTIVRWTHTDDSGHFAALEQPDLLVADLRDFVANLVRG